MLANLPPGAIYSNSLWNLHHESTDKTSLPQPPLPSCLIELQVGRCKQYCVLLFPGTWQSLWDQPSSLSTSSSLCNYCLFFHWCLFARIKQCFAGTWEQPCSVSFLLCRQCEEALGRTITSLARFLVAVLKLVLPVPCCRVDLGDTCTPREQKWSITGG